MIKLIAFDLDGTLLTDQKTVQDYTKEQLEKAAAQGIYIVPVTGRPLSGIPDAVKNLKGLEYIITSNGASSINQKSGELFNLIHISRETCSHLLESIRKYNIIKEIFMDGLGYTTPAAHQKLLKMFEGTPLYQYFIDTRIPVASLEEYLKNYDFDEGAVENISLVTNTKEECDEIIEMIGKNFPDIHIIRQSHDFVEMTSNNADKGLALLSLAARLGIQPSEIMAFGDGPNDTGLLASVGQSYAMANAKDFVKKTARFQTDDNNHDGIGKAVSLALKSTTSE